MRQYDLEKTVVHCETKEQFEQVLRWHESKNDVWASRDKPFDVDIDNYFSYYNNDLCVILGNIFYNKVLSYAQKEGYTILSFSDFQRDFLSSSQPIILSLSTAKEWYKKGGELKEVALKAYDESELKEKEILTWEDYTKEKDIKDFYLYKICNSKTDKHAKSMEAFAKISHLLPIYNEGWEPDWENGGCDKFSINYFEGKISMTLSGSEGYFLTFKSPEIRDKFIKHNEQLVKDYLMID